MFVKQCQKSLSQAPVVDDLRTQAGRPKVAALRRTMPSRRSGRQDDTRTGCIDPFLPFGTVTETEGRFRQQIGQSKWRLKL